MKILSLWANKPSNMALINKRIEPGEIAAIYYHVFGGCDDWAQLYAIADGIKGRQIYDINRNTISKWKSLPKIQDLIKTVKSVKDTLLNQNGQNGTEQNDGKRTDNERSDSRPNLKNSKFVDYSNPDNQTAKLNELVNTADNPGEALDALKVIIQGQRQDKESAKAGRVVRAYLPVSCTDCPLYAKAREKHAKKVTI